MQSCGVRSLSPAPAEEASAAMRSARLIAGAACSFPLRSSIVFAGGEREGERQIPPTGASVCAQENLMVDVEVKVCISGTALVLRDCTPHD